MKKHFPVLSLVRCALLFAIIAFCWYFAAMFRTSSWGYHDLLGSVFISLATFCIVALPFSLIPLIGLPWRRKGLIIVTLAILCISSVELYARGQEYLLVRRLGEHPTRDYTEPRWWPFEYHSVGFVQGEWWGCD